MVKFTEADKKLTCSFAEKLDTENCMKLQDELYEKIRAAKGMAVIFDMEKVEYVSSIFLSICIRITKEVGQENFSLINVRPNVKKVFKISGLDGYITLS